jgi:pyruvate dehydrogenase E1 component beta subunit
MRELTYLEAINEALQLALEKDENVFLIGEDIGRYGGGFGVTEGLIEQFGPERVRETPIAESAIAGISVGAAISGMRPVMEIQFSDFVTIAMDQIVNQAAKMHYMSGGQMNVPIVVRMATGSGTGAGSQHSQSLESWFTHVPGLIVVFPSNARDAKGLMLAAIENNNPVIFFEHKKLYQTSGPVPEDYYTVEIGKAKVVREGVDVTIVATGIEVANAISAAEILHEQGIDVEVIDPRTLYPFDIDTVLSSIEKTSRVLVVTEEVKNSGFGAEIVSQIAESDAAVSLKTKIRRLGGAFTPIPHAQILEEKAIPQVENIVSTVLEMMNDGK